jgi:hypothetical protein
VVIVSEDTPVEDQILDAFERLSYGPGLRQQKDMHYSLIMSLSEEAVEKIRNILLNSVQEIEPVLKVAKDETVYALNMDLFNVSR